MKRQYITRTAIEMIATSAVSRKIQRCLSLSSLRRVQSVSDGSSEICTSKWSEKIFFSRLRELTLLGNNPAKRGDGVFVGSTSDTIAGMGILLNVVCWSFRELLTAFDQVTNRTLNDPLIIQTGGPGLGNLETIGRFDMLCARIGSNETMKCVGGAA